MERFFDKNEIELKDGDVIELHQTVNGRSEFYIQSIVDLDVRYNYDRNHKYEYDVLDLLSPSKLLGYVEYEIINR